MTQCPVSLTFTPLTLAQWNADAFVYNLPYRERLVERPQLFFFLPEVLLEILPSNSAIGENVLKVVSLERSLNAWKNSKGRNVWLCFVRNNIFIYIVMSFALLHTLLQALLTIH